METITETSEAPAETTGADNNAEANLSIESLASSFMEKVENEETETSTEVAEEASTEAETVEAEEEEDGEDVLSQSSDDEEDDSEELTDDVTPKGLQKALKRINQLTARAKGAEEEAAALKEQIETLKSQPKQEAEQVEGQPALDKVQSLQDLETLRKEAVAAKKWALQNIGKSYVEVDGREYDDDEIRNILTEAEEYLTEKIPARAQFLQQRQTWIQDTANTFPWSQKGQGAEWELFVSIRDSQQYKPLLDSLPNGDFVAATIVEGINSIKARQEKSQAKPKVKTKTPPPEPSDAVAPPVQNKQAREQKKKQAILGKGNVSVDQFASYLT
jgi:hypothetical protein